MDPKHLLPLILLLIPGYVAFEIANGLGWIRSRRSEKLRFFSVVTMGASIFLVLSLTLKIKLLSTFLFPEQSKPISGPGELWQALANPETGVTFSTIFAFILLTLVAGWLWAAWRGKALPALIARINRREEVQYHGERLVWEKVIETIDSGKWVKVHTSSNRVIMGYVEIAPDFEDDRDLLIRAYEIGTEKENHFEPVMQALDEDFDRLIYIPHSEITMMQIYVEKEEIAPEVESEPVPEAKSEPKKTRVKKAGASSKPLPTAN